MAPPNHPTPPNPYNFLQIVYVLQPFSKVGWSWVVGWKWGPTPMNALHFAREYVASQPPAIAGSKGHNATFRVACQLVGFGLNDAQTLELLREFNSRCQPPWTEKELRHKVQDARKKVRLLRGPGARKAVRLTWNPEWFRLCLAALPSTSRPAAPTGQGSANHCPQRIGQGGRGATGSDPVECEMRHGGPSAMTAPVHPLCPPALRFAGGRQTLARHGRFAN